MVAYNVDILTSALIGSSVAELLLPESMGSATSQNRSEDFSPPSPRRKSRVERRDTPSMTSASHTGIDVMTEATVFRAAGTHGAYCSDKNRQSDAIATSSKSSLFF